MTIELTTEAGRGAACEAVAKAMGWRHIKAQTRYPAGAGNYAGAMATIANWYRVRPDGGLEESVECPNYLSDDPALNAEMWKALPRESNTWWRISEGPVSTGERWYWVQRGWDTGDIDECGTTLAEALVLALDAAGLLDVEKPNDGQ